MYQQLVHISIPEEDPHQVYTIGNKVPLGYLHIFVSHSVCQGHAYLIKTLVFARLFYCLIYMQDHRCVHNTSSDSHLSILTVQGWWGGSWLIAVGILVQQLVINRC